jgi:hypothetical protein
MAMIKFASPAGSGMNFALQLLRLSFYGEQDEFVVAGHERKDILDPVPTLVILRNPYDAIASAAERHLRSSEHDTFKNDINLIEDDDISQMIRYIYTEKYRYTEFFKDIEGFKHLKILSFDLLTQNPDLFVSEVAKHFNTKSEIIKRSEKEVLQAVIESGNPNRVPREMSKGRIRIDRLIRAMYSEEELDSWGIYVELMGKIEGGLV